MCDFDDLPRFPGGVQPSLSGPARYARSRRDDDDDDDDRPSKKSKKPAKSGGMSMLLIILGVLGVLGCCICVPIIGVVVALVVPAVSKVRETAARTQSTNNLKQIGLAFHSYHDAFKSLPTNGSKAPAVGGNSTSGSWAFQILPFIEQQPVFQKVDRNAPIPTYLCPGRSRPALEQGGGAWTDYFINGYLNDPMSANTPAAPNKKRTLMNITDGASNTVMVGHGNISTDQYTKTAGVTLSTNIFDGGTAGTMRAGNPANATPAGVNLARDSTKAPQIGDWGGPFSAGGLMVMGDAGIRIFPYTASFGPFLTPSGGEIAMLPD